MPNAVLGFFTGGTLSDHWPDLAISALFALGVWFVQRWVSSMDKRHQRAEDKFENVDDSIADHETRITVIEDRDQRPS